jgi:hypothetical protein
MRTVELRASGPQAPEIGHRIDAALTASGASPAMAHGRAWRAFASHAATAAAVVASVDYSGESPRIAIYGFYFHYVCLLLTAWACMRMHGSGRAALQRVARALTRPPRPGRPSTPVTEGGRPARFRAYLIVMAALSWFTFVMVNVADQEIVTPGPVIRDELRWGLAVAAIWWLQDLWDRRVVMRFEEPLTTNLGWNSQGTTVGALAVLTGGIGSAVAESPWPCFVALLFFKHLCEFAEDVCWPAAAAAHSGGARPTQAPTGTAGNGRAVS